MRSAWGAAVEKVPYITPGDVDIYDVLAAEIVAINGRRAKHARPLLPVNTIYREDRNVLEAVGLALSGGGIRSAAFSLGVLQALNQQGVIGRVDYLSTVSGGGYIGAAMTASMSATGGEFAFGRTSGEGDAPPASDVRDTDAVAHIRNYSNYLIPFGMRDVLTASAIIVRGLVANFLQVLPWLLLFASATLLVYPTRSSLGPSDSMFDLSLRLALFAPFFFGLWALYRSLLPKDHLTELGTWPPTIGAWLLVVLVGAVFLALQPLVLSTMFHAADPQVAGAAKNALPGGLVIQALAIIATPVWIFVKFFSQQLNALIEVSGKTQRWRTWLAALLARLAVWIAGLALPLLIWIAYLYPSYWGIANDVRPKPPVIACEQVSGDFSLDFRGGDRSGALSGKVVGEPCPVTSPPPALIGPLDHMPAWLHGWVDWLVAHGIRDPRQGATGALLVYFPVALVLLLLGLLLGPNANSLHRLYRDRISKAFLFDPQERTADDGVTRGRDFRPLDALRLTELSATDAPYHLINATLNIQGSDFANRRGRNGDFFLISRDHVGSVATGYAETGRVEADSPDFNFGTAVAVSGAAASADMGSRTIRPLTPTLALLNVRLAYWLKNPHSQRHYPDPSALPSRWPFAFLWAEIVGRLREDGKYVYLSDGGHIENLGLYELLKRKCRVIICIDCDRDGDMTMPSFVTVQRYARIDLGIRISLPWQKMAEKGRAWMGVGSKDRKAPEGGATRGPHVAIGKIDYGAGEIGYLVYVKPSLSGDENDYIRDYARRHATYPHELTGDQFFGEEQFEVYRALGFHTIFGFLDGGDDVVVHGEPPAAPPATPPSQGSLAAQAVFTVAPPPPWRAKPPAHPPVVDSGRMVRGKDGMLKPLRDLLGLTT